MLRTYCRNIKKQNWKFYLNAYHLSMKKINKIQVSIRQLTKAIRLYFEKSDPIVIHSLVAPAHQILVDLSRFHGKQGGMLKKKENDKENHKAINFAFNFLKHADKDPESYIYMHEETWEESLEIFLIDSSLMLIGLVEEKEIPIEVKIYFCWYSSKYKEKFSDISKVGSFASISSSDIGSWDFVKICQFFKFSDVYTESAIT